MLLAGVSCSEFKAPSIFTPDSSPPTTFDVAIFSLMVLEKDELEQIVIYDKRKRKIKLSQVKNQGDETILYVKSENKAKKEDAMVDKIGERFEQGLSEIELALHKKGGTK